jgi:hypothetical protein
VKPSEWGNPIRTVRVDDELWTAAKARAAREGVSVSSVLVAALRAYVAGEPVPELPPPPVPGWGVVSAADLLRVLGRSG